ncbi:MAG: hypothetical protein WCD35_04320 [Mycobacteriales bacterium]
MAAETATGMEGRYQSLYASASIGGMVLSPLLGTTLYGVAPALLWPAAGATALVAARWIGQRQELEDRARVVTTR